MTATALQTNEIASMSRKFGAYPAIRRSRVWGVPALPEHWQEKPLNSVAAINTDKLPETTDPDYDIEYVDIGNVSLEAGVTSTERLRFETAPSRARRKVRHGDTIVSTVRTYLKAVAQVVNPPDNLIVSTGFAVLRANPSLDPGFLYRLAQSEPLIERIMAHSVGVSYPAINASEIGKFSIPFPPLDEQRTIAWFLERETARIDGLIAKKQRLIELLKEKRQAVISRAVTKGLDQNAPMKPSGIDWLGDVPKHWNMKRIGFLTVSQGGCTPSKDNTAFWNGDIPWVTPKDMKTNEISDSIDHVTKDALHNTGLKLIPSPVVLIVVRGMILAHTFPVALTQAPVTINQDMKALKPAKTLDAEFLSFLLRACSPAFFAIVEESGHGTRVLRTDLWSKQELPIPPIEEQKKIADFVRQAAQQHDVLASKVECVIGRLNDYRSALITSAVTGQIDIRNLGKEAT